VVQQLQQHRPISYGCQRRSLGGDGRGARSVGEHGQLAEDRPGRRAGQMLDPSLHHPGDVRLSLDQQRESVSGIAFPHEDLTGDQPTSPEEGCDPLELGWRTPVEER
jgi:hypothetical protein